MSKDYAAAYQRLANLTGYHATRSLPKLCGYKGILRKALPYAIMSLIPPLAVAIGRPSWMYYKKDGDGKEEIKRFSFVRLVLVLLLSVGVATAAYMKFGRNRDQANFQR